MYKASFGLKRRPFMSMPQVDQYFPGAAIESARQTLVRCIKRAEGIGVVIGPSGIGKTLLCQMLAEEFRDVFAVAMLHSGRLSTRQALFQAILYELNQPYRGMDEEELHLALVDHVTLADDCLGGLLLLVDEAHTLPLRLLEEIRMISNLARNEQPAVRLVLAGGRMLEERLASPKLESLSQRLVARCYLESLDRDDTAAYVHAQINNSGGRGEQLFPLEACLAVYRATDGVPRLINQVCDHALLLAYAAGRKELSSQGIDEAWADLQQLPTPWNGNSQDAESGVIEFGGLEDESPLDEEPCGDEASEAPALRVSPTDEEQFAEPADQLECIEKTLAKIDEDFQPAGSIGPEVELVFHENVNPFDEEFAEEEVIADRLVAPTREASQPPPVTGSRTDDDQDTGLPETAEVGEPLQQQPARTPEECDPQTAETTDTEAQSDPEPETVRFDHQQPLELVEPEDEDLIVVQDEEQETDSPPAQSVPMVRRQEYRQLFAKLRRG